MNRIKTTSTLAPTARPFPITVDATIPTEKRFTQLTAALPASLQRLLETGTVGCGSRFAEDGRFVGVSRDWRPPSVVEPQQAVLAHRVLAELRGTLLVPADPVGLLGRVFALLSHFPTRGMAAEVEQIIAADWAEDLAGYPIWAVEHAARLWRRSQKWRPSIAEIRALCEDACAPERELAKRLAAVAEAGTTQAPDASSNLLSLAGCAVRRMSS